MELIGLIEVFNIIVVTIGTLFYMCCRPLIFSSSSSAADSIVADYTAVAADDDDGISPSREKHDVFISYRGPDTRITFTCHLYEALREKNIETYIDDRLQTGETIGRELRVAIEKSKLWVVIFSQNYASSPWCLNELVHIHKCNKRGSRVIPVFYGINVSDVRKQRGSYAVAFDQHQRRFKDSIKKWKKALTKAANISGFHQSGNARTDAHLIKQIVTVILAKLSRDSPCDLEGLFGIESHIKAVESLLGIHPSDPCIIVGIWGMGGIGKTTLADALYRKHSSKFEGYSFVNVGEKSEQADGLDRLENTLHKEILKEEVLPTRSTIVSERLGRTNVLMVLDDVRDPMQMERLARICRKLGNESKVIITSRDRSTLKLIVEEDKIYEVKGLKSDDALQLFCSHAFKNNTPKTDYKGLAKKVVDYAGHVPFALKVLGLLFFNCKRKEEWDEQFNKLKRYPSESIQKGLRISYDLLGKHEKEIFLDITCFHKGRVVDEAKRMLEIRGFFATIGIGTLIDMSLISIDSKQGLKTIQINDLLQEMGRTIVQEQIPTQRTRLFNDKDVDCVLKSHEGTTAAEAIFVNWPLKRADFRKLSNLRLLIVDNFEINDLKFTASLHLDLPDSLYYLYWNGYPLESLPSKFSPENLVELHLRFSKVEKLWKEDQSLVNLEVFDLSFSSNLTEVPNLSGSPKIVNINLHGCVSLVEIPLSFQHFDNLTHLDIGGCTSLKYLPEMPRNIEYLDLQDTGIKKLPDSVLSNEKLSYLNRSHFKGHETICTSPI